MKRMELLETREREKAIVVGVATDRTERSNIKEHLDELALLADTAGADVGHRIVQDRQRVDPATFIGSGKAKEIGALVEEHRIDLVIFDEDLSPVQVRNLERDIKCKILDRSGLILDIFATRAKSKEAMTQVELAQLQYMLPRLTRQWTHLSKQYGGVGTKGPGETQIETDRRAIRTRISHLKKKLMDISKEREVQRKGRRELPRVALVGYTNAGKSTLLRLLSGSETLIENRLFATLDTTVRKVSFGAGKEVLLSDTVGFIRKLPSHLIASFRTTLAETAEADILLHVVDLSHPQFHEHIAVVNDTLSDLNAAGKPTIFVFNKIDLVTDRSIMREVGERYTPSVFIAAARGINASSLEEKLVSLLEEDITEQTLVLDQADSRTIAKLHDIAEIVEKQYEDNCVRVRLRVSAKNSERLLKLLGQSKKEQSKKGHHARRSS